MIDLKQDGGGFGLTPFSGLSARERELIAGMIAREHAHASSCDEMKARAGVLMRWPSSDFDTDFSYLEDLCRMGSLKTYNPPSRSRGFHENKTYLTEMYNAGLRVIPSFSSKREMLEAGYVEKTPAVYKPLNGSSSKGLVFEDLGDMDIASAGIFQPAVDFNQEVSLFFIDNKFAYAVQSGGPGLSLRWQLTELIASEDDIAWAETFVKWNGLP